MTSISCRIPIVTKKNANPKRDREKVRGDYIIGCRLTWLHRRSSRMPEMDYRWLPCAGDHPQCPRESQLCHELVAHYRMTVQISATLLAEPASACYRETTHGTRLYILSLKTGRSRHTTSCDDLVQMTHPRSAYTAQSRRTERL